MVKVLNPLYSQSAHGRFGNIVFQGNQFGQFVRVHVPQRYRPSEEQIENNYKFGAAADAWRLLSAEEKTALNVEARQFGITGFNLYIKRHFHDY